MKSFLILGALVILLTGSVVIFGRAAYRDAGTVAEIGTVNREPVAPQNEPRVTFIDPVRGPREAPVTIVEFADYYCEFCREIEPVVQEILATYPREVRLIWKDFPNDGLHSDASQAAAAARCAGEEGKFWEYHDLLIERLDQTLLVSHGDLAAALLLDRAPFTACLEAERMKPRVFETLREAESLSLPGVPFFFINGKPFSGTTVEEFRIVIDQILKR